jgi:hypothetical protein
MRDIDGPGLSRAEMLGTVGIASLCASVTLAVYYSLPIPSRPHHAVWWRLAIAIVAFVAVLVHELGAILRHARPMNRAVVAMAVLLPLFVCMFSWTYLTMSQSNPAMFGMSMSRSEALYYTITVLSTVGFGDITPKLDPSRLVTTVQMVSDLILFAVVVRLILGAASRAQSQRQAGRGEARPGP